MQLKENQLFYTPETQEELTERIAELAKASGNAAAVWSAVMMFQNFLAREQSREVQQ